MARAIPLSIVIGVAWLAGGACASKRPPAVAAVDTAQADRLVDVGCYGCLREAFDVYRRAMAAPGAPPSVRSRAFVTALLLAVREKEIGADAAMWLEEATALATPADQTYLSIAAALQWQQSAAAPDFQTPPLRRETAEQWRSFLESDASHPLLARYLRLSIVCDVRTMSADPATVPAIEADAPLLLHYRHGICSPGNRPELESVAATEPRYAEAQFYLGRFEIAEAFRHRDWIARTYPFLTAAYGGLPNSPVIAVTLAGVVRGRSELERALGLYDEAIATRPTDRDAILGRAVMLAALQRYDEAIVAATRLLALGTWHIGDAYYWRAWSKYYSGRLDDAALDIAEATRLLISTDVMTLSGMIAYDQRRRADARRDFDEALRRNGNNCGALSYLGRIDADEIKWAQAAARFAASADCYRDTGRALESEADALLRQPGMDGTAVRSGYDRQIADARLGAARASLNAAQSFARTGDRARAIEQARAATAEDRVAIEARALLVQLESMR